MKTTKAKGFTLIELIVVIAIIGVLAAILVPTMLGYVTKSRCSSSNANAKSFYNAVNSALVDLDSEGQDISALTGGTDSLEAALQPKVENYFADYKKLSHYQYQVTNGSCTAVWVQNGSYYGSYPVPTVVDTTGLTQGTDYSSDCKSAPAIANCAN